MTRAAFVAGLLAGAVWFLPLALQTCAGPWIADALAERYATAAYIAETGREPGR